MADEARPLSSTAASIILNPDDTIHMVLGGSGGSRIFPSLAQVLLNVQCGLNLSAAVERPRVHNQIVPPVTTLEVGPEGMKEGWGELVKDLEKRGHEVGVFDINIAISEGGSLSFFLSLSFPSSPLFPHPLLQNHILGVDADDT